MDDYLLYICQKLSSNLLVCLIVRIQEAGESEYIMSWQCIVLEAACTVLCVKNIGVICSLNGHILHTDLCKI